jgi:hypothetical protein
MRTIAIIAAATLFMAGCGDTKKAGPKDKAGQSAAHSDMDKEMERMNEMMVKHLGESDAEYDHRFIDLMIPHHEGAVMMAKHALDYSNSTAIKEMAKKMIQDQEKEIEHLKKMQKEAHDAGNGDHKSHGKGADHRHQHDPSASTANPTTKLTMKTEPTQLQAGEPATWELRIIDAKSGEAINDFDVVHENLLHLIVVSKDLSWFNHVHPKHQGKGVFTKSATVPRAGPFKLYADYTPTGRSQQVAQHEFNVEGPSPLPDTPQLAVDRLEGAWIKKQVQARPEGEPEGEAGPTYEVALMPMPSKFAAGQDVMLHFQIRDDAGKPIPDLQPYLGALGHAVILSEDSNTYLHAHPSNGEGHEGHSGAQKQKEGQTTTAKSGGPDVMFHTSFPDPGLYKAWGQFMHNDRIITASYVMSVLPGDRTAKQ